MKARFPLRPHSLPLTRLPAAQHVTGPLLALARLVLLLAAAGAAVPTPTATRRKVEEHGVGSNSSNGAHVLLPKAASGSVLVPCPDNNYSSSPSFPLAAATMAWTGPAWGVSTGTFNLRSCLFLRSGRHPAAIVCSPAGSSSWWVEPGRPHHRLEPDNPSGHRCLLWMVYCSPAFLLHQWSFYTCC